jgi:hypothetical protein
VGRRPGAGGGAIGCAASNQAACAATVANEGAESESKRIEREINQ